jgi:hypothetical protein
MPGCSAVGCSIRRETELRMFRFPCEESRRAIWIGKVYDSSCNSAVITCSALALSTVLRTTSLSYGNMPFSGTHPTKTP